MQQRQSSQTFSMRNTSVLCNSNDDRSDMLDLMTFLLEHHIPLIGIEIVQPTLEDVFIRLTQDGREAVSYTHLGFCDTILILRKRTASNKQAKH